MQSITEFMNSNSNVKPSNVHDAILNVLRKYYEKVGVSKDVKDYCDKVREALDTIK